MLKYVREQSKQTKDKDSPRRARDELDNEINILNNNHSIQECSTYNESGSNEANLFIESSNRSMSYPFLMHS